MQSPTMYTTTVCRLPLSGVALFPEESSELHDGLAKTVADVAIKVKLALIGDGTEQGGLRHRKKGTPVYADKDNDVGGNTEKKVPAVDDDVGKEKGDTEDAKTKTRRKDPIYMFSALPPKSLRNAQSVFSELVALLPEL
ncbi:hypothetical protein BC830DRAFT_580097 [Chytriomyces sp. MP71]|nr:hypothetical protein BC830DRAFT_580097 [Chytriomyces sp. MP71]